VAEERERKPSFPGSGKRVVLPRLGASIVDTHAHLDMLDDPVGALVRAACAGVELVCSVVDLTEEPEATLDAYRGWIDAAAAQLADAGPESPAPPVLRLIVGVHPHNASHYDTAMRQEIAALAARLGPGVVAGIGEAGLDFHYDYSPRDDQRAAFRDQLRLAGELGLPVTVHLRDGHEEGLAILAEVGVPAAGCIIHCFTEGPDMAERFLALSPDVYISFAGPITFAKAEQVRETAKIVPLERALVETDSPFLAPAPYRGEANEPAFVTVNAAKLAEVRGADPVEVARATSDNARRVFLRGTARGER
jgi:TatD DNase family protein